MKKLSVSWVNFSLLSLILSSVLVASAEDEPTVVLEAQYEFSIDDARDHLRPGFKELKDSLPTTLLATVVCFSDHKWSVYPSEAYYSLFNWLTQHGRNILYDSVVRDGVMLCKSAHMLIQETSYEF